MIKMLNRPIPKEYEIYLTEEEINKLTLRLALKKINPYYEQNHPDQKVVVIEVLNGATMFASDLLKLFEFECIVDYIKVKTYPENDEQSSGRFKVIYDIDHNIEGKCVLVLDEMADTRLTTRGLRKHLMAMNPKDLKFCVAFNKEEAKKYNEEIHFIGTNIPNRWAIGYGLDGRMGSFRNLPFLALKKE